MANTTITPGAGGLVLAGIAFVGGISLFLQPPVGGLALGGVGSPMVQAGPVPLVSIDIPFQSATVTWVGLVNGQQGQAQPRLAYQHAEFQVTGTFGTGGSVRLEGSNDGVGWSALTPAALVAAGLFAALGATERPKFIRPNVTAGDATTSLTVIGWFA